MERIELTHWRGKLLNEMSKEELIEALNDAYHLKREANLDNIQNMIEIGNQLSGIAKG